MADENRQGGPTVPANPRVPAPRAAKPEELRVGPGESPIGVRVGSEAAMEGDRVVPVAAPNRAHAELTEVHNAELRRRDEKEFKKRGMRPDGSGFIGRNIAFSGEGVFVVEHQGKDGPEASFVSGGTTVVVPQEGVLIRPLSAKEEQQFFGAPSEVKAQRSNDLVKGGGQGGGGNPMHAGDVKGVSSNTAERVGQGGVTSKTGPAPAPRPSNAGSVTPQGGGSTSRSG